MDTTGNRRALPDDVAELQRLLVQHLAELAASQARIAQLEQQVRVLSKWAFAPRSERRPRGPVDPGALQGALLFPELIAAAERVADEKQVQGTVEARPAPEGQSKPRGKPARRQQFPGHLPVVRTTLELLDAQRRCGCGAELAAIGEDVSRELERIELCVVHEIARTKYACKGCQGSVRTAPGPDRVIDKGLLGVGFLAHLLVQRFAMHLPYNRLEKQYGREGLSLSRTVLCESAVSCAQILAPIAEQIRKDALASGVVQTDDTPVVMQDRQADQPRQSRLWVYRGLGGEVFFDPTATRSRDGPSAVLADYRGYVQADAYGGYDHLFKGGTIVEVGCWAHARRYFVDAEATDPTLAKEALARIGELYGVERDAKERGLHAAERLALRQERSVPRLAALRDWMAVTRTAVLDKSPLARAIDYSLSNWVALARYTEDGRLEIDNNGAERALRSVAVGRKNWLFFGNERGGQTAAVMYSLLATCQEHGVEPGSYLRDVLLRIGTCTDVRELTPYGWKQRWAPVVAEHRASILERLLAAAGG